MLTFTDKARERVLKFISEEDGAVALRVAVQPGSPLALEYELKFGLLGRLMDRFMVKRQFDKVVPAVLSGLKRHMERGARSNGNGKPIRKELNHG